MGICHCFGRFARIMSLIVTHVCLLAMFVGPACADSGLDGVWEGSLTAARVDVPTGDKSKPFSLRIEISGESARVWYKSDSKWVDVARSFRVQRLRSNAVVTSIDSGRDEEGIWVETWSIALAQKRDDVALAVYSRLVNNENLPMTSDHKAFSAVATGELARSSR